MMMIAVASWIAATHPVAAQTQPDLGAMLNQAQRFTVKVRGTVLWPFAPEQMGTGLGTGFIIDRDKGWILTNAHVAKRSPSTVEIAVGETETDWLPAERIYVDNHLDIAVLKVAPDKLPADAIAAKLGCTHTIKQGATVVAYGHPISLSFTATRGIVSSVRTLSSHEFVQMDANINPGNSGGPLLAVDVAEVIGINTATINGAAGLGLALAIRHVCPVIDLLAKGSDPSLPSLPVYWMKQGRVETLTVAAPFPDRSKSQTDGEGTLSPGDIVQGITGGTKFASLPELYTALRGKQGSVSLDVLRDGKSRSVTAVLIAARPPLKRQAITLFGLLVTERNSLDTADLSLPPLRIEFVKPGEAASRVGFQPWDHLESVGGKRFTTIADLHEWLKAKPATEKISVLVRRGSMADPRVSADYYKFDLQTTDLRFITAGD
jgi:serine protease Do